MKAAEASNTLLDQDADQNDIKNTHKLAELRQLLLKDLKTELKRILQQKFESPIFTLRDDHSTHAKCWSQFRHVYEKKRGVPFVVHGNGFVVCNLWGRVFACLSANGTRTLNEHMKKCTCSSVKSGALVHFLSTQHVSGADKKRVMKAAAKMCCSDLRLFNIVAGEGFKHFVSVVLDIGLRSKRPVDVNDLLPVPNSVRNNVVDDAAKIRDLLLLLCCRHFKSRAGAGFTTDLWTDSTHKKSFMSLTMHYLTETFAFFARTLQVKEVKGSSHTAEFLLGEFNTSLSKFGIHDTIRCTVVTDCGSNLCGSQRISSVYHWIPCADQKLATIIIDVLCKKTSTTGGVLSASFYRYKMESPEVFQLLDRCKALVTYVKKSKLQIHLSTTLKQENVTRWNSQFALLESMLISFDDVTSLLATRGKLMYVNCIDKPLLVELVGFLRPFKEATLKLEEWQQPTLHLDVHERHKIIGHLSTTVMCVR